MKDEKYKPASSRQIRRIHQLVKIHGVSVNLTGTLTGHRATQLINRMTVQLRLGRGERLPALEWRTQRRRDVDATPQH